MYKLTNFNSVINLSDGVTVPLVTGNSDYAIYQQWLAAGNTPQAAQTPTEIKTAKWSEIKAKRDTVKSQGVLVGTKWFHTDESSRIQMLGLVMMGASIPANLQWKTMDGSFVTMNQTLASQVFSAIAVNDQTIFANAETHKTAMEASATPDTYDFSTSWPAIYV